jgi:hypothetical protein
MNKGTAEQEQNGVTIPTIAAKILPAKVRFPEEKTALVLALENFEMSQQ